MNQERVPDKIEEGLPHRSDELEAQRIKRQQEERERQIEKTRPKPKTGRKEAA